MGWTFHPVLSSTLVIFHPAFILGKDGVAKMGWIFQIELKWGGISQNPLRSGWNNKHCYKHRAPANQFA